uniref:Putative transposase (Putative), gypsy type n=1 Tax=Tanacetum cinerariifolium TaxID=118510 RepID=A0A6L2MPZ0_TANCI|nr:putative transposase (putative), gypsy type [Tanacetum cinerariifolium]
MHERPGGKIGLYTRFFDFANFRLPLSTFLVDILMHFRINVSQLSVIGAAKVSRFEFLCHVYEIVPTVGLFRCFYVNSKKSGWMSFSKRFDNAAFLKALLCLVGLSRHYPLDEETYPQFVHKNEEDMDLFDFVHASDPTKVRIVEREQDEDEPRLLETTVGRTVPQLIIALDRAESELEASVDRLFDEGGSGHQTEHGDFTRGEQDANIQPIVEAADMIVEDSLLAGAVLNAEVGVTVAPTLPFVTASVSTTPEREDEDHTNVVVEHNLRTIRAPQRFVISSNSSHHFGPTIAKAEVDSLVRSSAPIMTTTTTVTSMVDSALVAKEKTFKPSLLFADSSSASGADPNTSVFWILLVVISSVTNGSRLDNGRVCREMVDEFAPPKSLSAKVRMQAEYNVKREKETEEEAVEAIRLCAEASNFETMDKSLWDEVHELEVSFTELQEKLSSYESLTERLEESQDAQPKIFNDKFDKLYADFVEMALHLEEKFYPRLLNTISGRMWLLTHGSIHGKEGRVLTYVAAHNPSAKAYYVSALQHLQNLGLTELQPNVDQLMVPIHHSPDKVVVGASALYLALDVSSIRVQKIRENIGNYRSDLRDVFVPFAKPFSAVVLTGLEVMGTDDQAGADGNVEPFSIVDDEELNIL